MIKRFDIVGDKNPMKKPEVVANFLGDSNPAKRPEVRKKISKALKGRKIYWKDKISNSMKGKKSHMKGKTWDELYEKSKVKLLKKKLSKRSNRNIYARGILHYRKQYFSKKLNHIIRSSWEEFVGVKLNENEIKYIYEQRRFEIDKRTTYTPDFFIEKNIVIEVKGFIFDWQLEKYKKFVKLYPDIRYIILTDKNIVQKFKNLNFETYDIKSNKWLEVIKNGMA